MNKNQNHYYYNIFLEKKIYQLTKKQWQDFLESIIMLWFGETTVTKEEFYGTKKPIKIWNVNVDQI